MNIPQNDSRPGKGPSDGRSGGDIGLPARMAAQALVAAALERRGGFDDAHLRPPFSDLAGAERSFARLLASTTLRGLGKIDAILDERLRTPPPPQVRSLLRIGAAQILFGVAPAFAAVSTTLAIAEREAGTRPFKGLINAVLRGVDRQGGPRLAAALDPSVNAPPWLAARWRGAYGEARTRALLDSISHEPATDLTLRSAVDAEAVAEPLGGVVLPGGTVRTNWRGDVSEWPGYTEGLWWVQDFAAAAPVRLLDVQPGETALDLCAAPGGKTLQLAAAGAVVTALDRSAKRLERVAENLARVGLTAEQVAIPAEDFNDPRQFDAVLLDAPCSATGTFRRHPDVLWGARPGDIAKLAGVQSRLLDAAADKVRPGGRMVYCVCSLEPEEGEAQIDAFLARRPDFVRAPASAATLGLASEAVTAAGDLRLLPGASVPEGGQDGFFAARLVRAPH